MTNKKSTVKGWRPAYTGFLADFHREATANGWAVTTADPQDFGLAYPWPNSTRPAGALLATRDGVQVLATGFHTESSQVRERMGKAWQLPGKNLGTVYQTLAALAGRDTSKDVHRKRTEKAQPLTSEQLAAFTKRDLVALAELAQVTHSKSATKAQLIQSLLDAQ